MIKYNRTNFLKTKNVQNIFEKDLATNTIIDMTITRPMQFYTIKQHELLRLDNISFDFYGTIDFWWILAKINKIDDLFNDLEVGQVIRIPDKNDINTFYLQNQKINRDTQ